MEPACIRHTDLPGTSRLFADFTYHFDRVQRFYRYDPHEPRSLEAAAAEIEYPDDRRQATVAALTAQNGESESLRRLAQPGTVAIVTGQQAGLFSGPAYTIYKAIMAARMAAELTARGIPAVPVFWLATEDHDFAEVNHVHLFDREHKPITLRVADPNNGRPRPVGGIVPDRVPVEELAAALAGFPHGEAVATLVKTAYPPGATMGAGFRAMLQELLGKLGLIFLDPLDPAIRQIGAPIMAQALESASELKSKLVERSRELEAAGYHAQVHLDDKTSLFFLLKNGERVPLRRAAPDLKNRATELSPNALLRPVVQDYLLPTAAYIGGPGEIAYFAQSQVIYEQLLGRMPVVASRACFTLVEPRAAKLLDRYRLSLLEILTDADSLQARMARELVPAEVERAFTDTCAGVERHLEKLRGALDGFDPTLSAALATSGAKIHYQLQKTRSKIERETMRRDRRASDDARYLHALLYPERHLQERYYSILPFVAEHGLDLIDRLSNAARLDCPD
ncbi:MAG: bacillithiol biosynthesis cysteine-adding enzyme BshC, partial [Bryobacteraceae bacterium]